MRASVSQWLPDVERELSVSGIPLPVNLVLAVIHVESRGKAGLVNPKSGASGLMQVMPGTLEWYNQQHTTDIPLSHLRSPNYGQEQIRVGLWVLAQFWKGAHKYLSTRFENVPLEELWRIADLFYVAGPGATRSKLDKLDIPVFANVESRWPKWNALPHPRNVGKHLQENPPNWDVDSIQSWLSGNITRDKKAQHGAILTLGVVLIIYWYYLRNKGV
jgi:hypothetical protein